MTAEQLTAWWIAAARRQLASTPLDVKVRLLRHMIGDSAADPTPDGGSPSAGGRVVFNAGASAAATEAVRRAGYEVREVTFPAFDPAAAAKVRHLDTYNRTEMAERVEAILDAERSHPGALLIADGDAGVAGLLAAAIAPIRLAVLGVSGIDLSTDEQLLAHAYVPGLQRAGGLQSAVEAAGGRVLVHGAGDRFGATGARVRTTSMTPAEIVAALRSAR